MSTEVKIQYIFGGLFLAGFFVLSWLLKDTETATTAAIITTMKDGCLLILAYFFGSSRGSAKKSDVITKNITDGTK